MAVRRLGTYEVGSSSNNPRTSAYNILPLNADAEICKLPEVKAARNELTRFPVKEGDDVFDLLKEKFLFQEDNIKNQREHLILLLSNARSADYDKDPASVKGKDQDLPVATVRSLFEKIMDNYWKWCSHVRIRSPDCRREEEDKQCMLKHVALYLCIWGEAANVRFLPECICFLFHNLAKLLEHQGPLYPEGQTFLTAIVTPIYEKIKEEADKGKTTNQKHSKWKNYDDFNELFWSNLLFKLPQDNPIQPSNQLHLPEDDPIQHFQHNPGQPSKIKYFKDHFEDAYKNTESKKISYVERRTFFHLYHSFVRVWILLIVLLEILVACAFSGNSLVLLLKLLICIGPTYFVMMFLKSVLDVVMMIGISVQVLSRCHVKASIIFQLLFYGACSFGTIFLYRKMILEMPPNEILLWMLVPLGAYVVIFILRHAVRRQVERMERYKFLACLNWLYRDYFYVGGRLSEKGFYYWRYALFWLLLLGCKASFSYFFQIKPLAEASKSIYPHNEIVIYQWHDLISKRNHNALALMSLWAPVILIYLLDIQIWFTVFSAVVGGILGSKDRLAEIHSLDMLRARFDTFPAELAVRLLASKKQTSAPKGIIISQAKTFSKFWNQIIKCLRNEDYIKDYEEELLIMPEGFNNYITWPLFLLAGKVSLAIKLATENPEELFERLKNDKFMSLAIREAYASASYYYDTLIDGHKDYEIKKLGIERKLSEIDKSSPDKEYKHIARIYRKVKKLVWLTDMDNQKKVNIRAVADALQSIYVDVSKFVKNEKYVQRADVRSTTMPNEIQVEDINLPANENKRTRRQKPLEPKFIRRLHWLLASTEAHSSVPKNEEAQRRLQFFTNSLFMRMPQAPSIRAMKAFSVLTPYYREPVIYSVKDLYLDNEDGISILFYLQKVFPDEWENLLERLKITEKMLTDILIKASNISTGKDAFSKSDAEKVRETRLWASYRGQTLARTVRGMMYYREALRFQACMEEREIEKNEINPEARAEALTDLKFSYVVSCQRYGEQKKHTEREEREKAEDIQELMRTHDGLRIAFVHSEGKCYYSKLIKMSDTGEQEIYKIQLPGNPILGEGKPENQNHSIIFTRGEALQAIDMNQDNYFEEALKMRNLLEQFKPPDKGPQATVLGVREHIFTGSVSSLAWFMSKQEASFVTLGQRVLARPLRVRMHYGHPDVFDRLFHLTRGGMSKASKAINVSEDVFAGFNSTMRNGNITHHEYIQVGKGRDVGLNQISMFEAKVSSGNAEQLLSRDVFRLGNSFDIFRLLSFYVTSVGYYACTMMTSLTIYVFLYGKAYLALSGLWRIFDDLALRNHDKPLQTALGTQFLFQIGFFTAIPMLVMFMIEEGFIKAVVNIVVMQLQLSSVFFTFSLGTRSHYFSRTVLQGGAKYQDTGRNFVVQHIKFAQNYRLYSRSHFVNAFEIMMLLIVIRVYGPQKSPQSYILFSFFCWFLAISWLFAPFIFNPSGFEWQKTVEDYNNWVKWLLGRDNFDPNAKDCWENWWMEQQASNASIMSILLRTALSLRFLFPQFGIIYHLEKVKNDTSILIYGISWLIFIGIIMLFLTFSYRSNYPGSMRPIRGVLYMILFVSFVMVEVLGIISINDIFATIFALIPTGWGLLCIAMIWSEYIQQSPIKPIWSIVKATAWYYDAAMGMLIFIPIAVLSWFQFVSIFQTRLLFNQAFSRGLEISRILSARKQQDDEGSTAKIK